MEIWHCRVPPLTLTLVTMDNTTTYQLSNWTALDQSELSLEELLLLVADNDTNATLTEDDYGGLSCGEWEPAQHNLFQLSNIFFVAAFLLPKKFKKSVLLLSTRHSVEAHPITLELRDVKSFGLKFLEDERALLCAGFIVSALWSGIHVCTPDMFAWDTLLAGLNLVHAVILTFRFLPPALSVELTELYVRMFKPLKFSPSDEPRRPRRHGGVMLVLHRYCC
ncbi:hypothetical protein J6590_016865 [Homalodisca vitripennis]|nr:hypothetical protein J6590_016865 [Homalodisca vitripennis]